MARFARIAVPGVAHHITQRGNLRQDVFFTDHDRRIYLAALRDHTEGRLDVRIDSQVPVPDTPVVAS